MDSSQTAVISVSTGVGPSTRRRSARISNALQDSQEAESPPKSPPKKRKSPTCRTCGQPTKGHVSANCRPPTSPSPSVDTGNNRRHFENNDPSINTVVGQLSHLQIGLGPASTCIEPDSEEDQEPARPSASTLRAKYPNAPLRRTVRTQEEHDYFHHEIVEAHPSVVYVMPLEPEDLQAQRDAAQSAGYHTRILQAQPSWQDRRDVLIFGDKSRLVNEHCKRVGRRAAEGLPWREILDGVGMARGFFADMMAVWSLFSALRG